MLYHCIAVYSIERMPEKSIFFHSVFTGALIAVSILLISGDGSGECHMPVGPEPFTAI
jgi:hypothetical protein